MEGFLKIKREIFSEKYYFVLTSDCLVFYKKKGEPVKGRFHLKISTITNADEKKPLNIILNNGFQDVLLEAEDIKKKMQWTNAILMRQDELRRLDNQDFYDMHNLDEIISKDAQISEEVKDNLENKFVNSLAELWNLQAIVEENLDNLASKFEKNNIIQVTFKKVEGAVANIKVKKYKHFPNFFLINKKRKSSPISPIISKKKR